MRAGAEGYSLRTGCVGCWCFSGRGENADWMHSLARRLVLSRPNARAGLVGVGFGRMRHGVALRCVGTYICEILGVHACSAAPYI